MIGGLGILAAAAIAVANGGGSDDPEVVTPTTPAPSSQDRSAGEGAGAGVGAEAGSTPPPGSAGAGSGDGAQRAGSAGAAPYCGESRYVQEISVRRWAGGDFQISLWPTDAARQADDRDDASAQLWTAVRDCVGTLDPAVTESLRDQLRCHEFLALVPGSGAERYATGETFDIESWRPTPGRRRWISTRCGNTLGTDPTTAPVRTYRPDGVPPRSQPTGEHA
ncbi:Protein of unknown function (DUF2599) [Frankia sp. EI5c]|nr:Protein of unknown function (DUF2599) [Frankia sp. EI5c]